MPNSTTLAAPADRTSASATTHLRGRRFWSYFLGSAVAVFVLRFVYFWVGDLADGNAGTLGHRLLDEATGALVGGVLLAAAVHVVRCFPIGRLPWWSWLGVHLAVFVPFTALHTVGMMLTRVAIGPLFGMDHYRLAQLQPSRFVFEAANDVLFYGAFVALLSLTDLFLTRRDRERRELELERTLIQAQLQNFRLQLQPHFLFNALNTIASAVYDDPAGADRMLGQLSELLRTSLRTTQAQEVALRDELATLELYLALMRARFGERMTTRLDVEPGTESVLVPSMLLQPLVENAARHGGLARTGKGTIEVRARRLGDSLEIVVRDDGPGAPAGAAPVGGGTGLSATAQRLRLLYGDEHRFSAGNAADGGFEVRIVVPARSAGDVVARSAAASHEAHVPARAV